MRKIMNVAQLVDFAADKYRDKDFCRFIRDGKVLTKSFTQFRSDAYAISRYIREKTHKKLHIAFIGSTSYEYVACLTGMIISGNTVVPFSPVINVNEAATLFDDADIDILFCEDAFKEKAQQLHDIYPALQKTYYLGDTKEFDDIFRSYSYGDNYPPAPSAENKEEPALIVYTSGTTGVKKGVMLSDYNLAANSTYNSYAMESDDVTFSILPMHHIFCYACDVLKTLYDGGTLCINGELSEMFANFLIFEPTVMRIVPAICRTLITKFRLAGRRDPSLTKREAAESVVGRNLRRLIAGSAFLSAALIDEFEEYGITARQGYGMSECSPRITTADFSDNCKYSNGLLTGVDEVRVVEGEIQVKGPSVMLGYYKKPEATSEAFTEDGFLHTGDTGRLENGHIYLSGRKKNIIVLSNGENISPEEIENCFADEEAIKEIIVYAKGDSIFAMIYPPETADHKEIENIINMKNLTLTADKQISGFSLVNAPFPKTSTGKIIRQAFSYEEENK